MTPKINIVHYSEVIDNQGKEVGSEKPKDILRVLRNSATFKKEFVKEYGEVKGSKEEKDLNAWLKNVWDERPTNEGQ